VYVERASRSFASGCSAALLSNQFMRLPLIRQNLVNPNASDKISSRTKAMADLPDRNTVFQMNLDDRFGREERGSTQPETAWRHAHYAYGDRFGTRWAYHRRWVIANYSLATTSFERSNRFL
jgi:hypothetical protein